MLTLRKVFGIEKNRIEGQGSKVFVHIDANKKDGIVLFFIVLLKLM